MSKMAELFKGMKPVVEVMEDCSGQWKAFVIPFPEHAPHYYFRSYGATAQMALRKAVVRFRRAKRIHGFSHVVADISAPALAA